MSLAIYSPKPVAYVDQSHTSEADHLKAYADLNIPWPPDFDETFIKKTKALGSSSRMREILYLREKVCGEACAAKPGDLTVADLNLSLEWGSWCERHLPCIACSSLLWIRGRTLQGTTVDRMLVGEEVLNIQGFEKGEQHLALAGLSFKQTMDLAGNAFASDSFRRVLLAGIITFDFAAAIKRAEARETGDTENSVGSEGDWIDEDDEEEDDDCEDDEHALDMDMDA